MRLSLIAVGRLKPGPLRTLYDDYAGRLAPGFQSIELEAKAKQGGPVQQAEEAKLIAAAIPDGAAVLVLDERGRALASRALAEKLGSWRDASRPIAAIIGGADGLTEELRRRADLLLAFGAMTWPHQLVRVMLAEQLYRAQTILSGHPYHRD